KAAFLAQHFGQTGFEYVGDSAADIEVWRNARAAYVVGTEARAEQAAAVTTLKATILEPRTSLRTSVRTWISALRGHHWAKNLLLFYHWHSLTIWQSTLSCALLPALCSMAFVPPDSTSLTICSICIRIANIPGKRSAPSLPARSQFPKV